MDSDNNPGPPKSSKTKLKTKWQGFNTGTQTRGPLHSTVRQTANQPLDKFCQQQCNPNLSSVTALMRAVSSGNKTRLPITLQRRPSKRKNVCHACSPRVLQTPEILKIVSRKIELFTLTTQIRETLLTPQSMRIRCFVRIDGWCRATQIIDIFESHWDHDLACARGALGVQVDAFRQQGSHSTSTDRHFPGRGEGVNVATSVRLIPTSATYPPYNRSSHLAP